MCENFNIELKSTAGYSPWSNGLLERHNQTLTSILMKIKFQQDCDWETALSWAVMAKNCLANCHGYSSYQLVYGRNPNLPSILTDAPPALEGVTSSRTVEKHISSLHKARQAFTEAESSKRLRRALRKQTRHVPISYQTGDKVFYRRPNSDAWKGPATVMGQDGAVIFARHGGSLVRVHRCRLRLTTEAQDDSETCREHSPLDGDHSGIVGDKLVCGDKDYVLVEDDYEPLEMPDNTEQSQLCPGDQLTHENVAPEGSLQILCPCLAMHPVQQQCL